MRGFSSRTSLICVDDRGQQARRKSELECRDEMTRKDQKASNMREEEGGSNQQLLKINLSNNKGDRSKYKIEESSKLLNDRSNKKRRVICQTKSRLSRLNT